MDKNNIKKQSFHLCSYAQRMVRKIKLIPELFLYKNSHLFSLKCLIMHMYILILLMILYLTDCWSSTPHIKQWYLPQFILFIIIWFCYVHGEKHIMSISETLTPPSHVLIPSVIGCAFVFINLSLKDLSLCLIVYLSILCSGFRIITWLPKRPINILCLEHKI